MNSDLAVTADETRAKTRATARCEAPHADINRREFLRQSASVGAGLALTAASASAVASSDDPLPMRVLGKTNEKVTILGLGTAPVGEGPVGVQEAIKIFGEVIDRGVNYVDTARGYGNAEEALGYLLPKRRDRLFVVTKTWTDSAAEAEKSLSESLRRLKIDHVDLCHIHHIGGKDINKVLAKDGVFDYLLKQKEVGKIRFLGLSGHARPPRFVQMLETDQIDVVMCVMNYADRNIYGFEHKVLPECRKRNVGVAAMKVYAGIKGGFPNHRRGHVGCATEPSRLPQALAYALDLEGVSVAVVGPYTLEQAVQNVEFARAYSPLSTEDRASLLAYGQQLAPKLGPRYGPLS
ncbi:MAG: aldo/keto reductase [Pirellulales bacterium]|nr:aldo/keto reductase [Pirellulales bacterium]